MFLGIGCFVQATPRYLLSRQSRKDSVTVEDWSGKTQFVCTTRVIHFAKATVLDKDLADNGVFEIRTSNFMVGVNFPH